MPRLARTLLSATCLAVSAGLLYSHVITKLVHDWTTDDNYSHGFLIPPIAAYLAWERRGQWARSERKPSVAGLLIVILSLGVLVTGVLGAELFLTRISMIGVIAGAIVYLQGWQRLQVLLFPIAFLLLMIPIPAIVFNQIALPLQFVASYFGATLLGLTGIPVLREGNVIVLANVTLEVAEACSGIRSLVSLLTLGIVVGYVGSRNVWVRSAIALSTVPIAIVTNGLRIAGTGVVARYYGPQAADGFLHAFSGWLMFVVALIMLGLLERAVRRARPFLSGLTDFGRRVLA